MRENSNVFSENCGTGGTVLGPSWDRLGTVGAYFNALILPARTTGLNDETPTDARKYSRRNRMFPLTRMSPRFISVRHNNEYCKKVEKKEYKND